MAKSSVDLLSSVPQPKSTWEKIFDWTFSVGRYLVVFVEAIVILAFISRFAMDRLKSDLDKQIDEVYVPTLEFYRDEGRTDKALLNHYAILGSKIALNNQPHYSDLFRDINELIGADASIRSINVDGLVVTVVGEASNLSMAEKIEASLKSTDFLKNIEFDLNAQSLRDGDETVEFTASGDISTTKYLKNYVTDAKEPPQTP